MHRFGFLFSVRFWVPVWLGLLFVGLLPLPPAAELVITIGVLSHTAWYVRGRFRRPHSGGPWLGPKRPKRRSTAGCVAGGPFRAIPRYRRFAES